MEPPLILLEFDDVIVASRDARRDALRRAAAVDDVTFSDSFFDERCAGQSFAAAARAVYSHSSVATDETALELAGARAGRSYAAETSRGMMLTPDVGAYLRQQAASARLGLVSATPAAPVTQLLELAGLAECFACVACVDDPPGGDTLDELWTRARARLLRRTSDPGAEVVALVASASAFGAARTAGCRASFMPAELRTT